MDDSLYCNEQHLAVREMVRALARDEVAPIAAQYDESQDFPWATVKRMGELGLLGIPWDESLGGSGFDLIAYVIAIQEMAKVCASHAITISAHTTLGTSPIVHFGTAAQPNKPARSTVKVGLATPGALVEIEMVAVKKIGKTKK